MNPRVSICVPNLNTRPFLEERFATIRAQSFQDWELLVYDSYSNDGAWEYIRHLAEREPRMRIWQGPREGAPGSWNPCIREARGEYVYVATSDDTMPPDCLEKLVAALDRSADCDIAHCPLRAIDEDGNVASEWWWQDSVFARSSGPLLHQAHVRKAPFDGLLHLLGESVYISVTQLLIRRSLFDRIGFYGNAWGSVSDFNWNMRASLVANTVHVPETWGGWRLHSQQATAKAGLGSLAHTRRIEDMTRNAFAACEPLLPSRLRERLKERAWAEEIAELRAFDQEIARRPHDVSRRSFVLRRLASGSTPAREHLKSSLLRRPGWPASFADRVRHWLDASGFGPVLLPVLQDSAARDDAPSGKRLVAAR